MIENLLLAGLNHVLGQSAWARDRLRPFAGRLARLSVPPFELALSVGDDGYFAGAGEDAAVDVDIALPADTPMLLAQGGLERVMQAARVEGSAEFATELAFVLRNLRWDAEEDLSRAVGDIAAHRIVAGIGGLAQWQRQAAGNLADNLAEYATEENRILVNRRDHKMFADEVAGLVESLERLEARADRLRR